MHGQQRQIKNIDGINRPVQKKSLTRRLKRFYRRSRLAQIYTALAVVGIIVLAAVVISNVFKRPNYDDVTTVKMALSKHMVLPQDEEPLLATVTDRTALKTPFLREADDGDRILIYEKARRVIIYRPSIDKIIDIGPVEVNNIPKTN